jgi:hypothetical protein
MTMTIKAKEISRTAGAYTRIDLMMIAFLAPESMFGTRNEIEQKATPNTAIIIRQLRFIGIKLI